MCDLHDHDTQELTLTEESSVEDRRRFVQALAAGGALTMAGPALSGCTTNPITGEKQFTGLIGASALNQMAAASWAEQKQQIPQTQDPRYLNRLKGVGSRINRVAKGVGNSWDYAVFDQDTKNAFVMPGGRVGFYRGMMDFTDNESQVASIMGHEVGHVAGRHAQERANQQMAGQLGLAGAQIYGATSASRKCRNLQGTARNSCLNNEQQKAALLTQALGLGFTFGVVLPYSRNHERQADLLGVNYLHRAGYDKGQAVRLWEKMAAESGGSRQPEFMSTHPDPASRARYIARYIQEQNAAGSQGYQDINIKDFDYNA